MSITLNGEICIALPRDVYSYTTKKSLHEKVEEIEVDPIERGHYLSDNIYNEITWNDYDKLSEIFCELNYEKSCNNLMHEMETLIPIIEQRILQFQNPFLSIEESRQAEKDHEKLEKLKTEIAFKDTSLIKKILSKISSFFK